MRYLRAGAPATNIHRGVMACWRIGQRYRDEEWWENKTEMCPVHGQWRCGEQPIPSPDTTSSSSSSSSSSHHIIPGSGGWEKRRYDRQRGVINPPSDQASSYCTILSGQYSLVQKVPKTPKGILTAFIPPLWRRT